MIRFPEDVIQRFLDERSSLFGYQLPHGGLGFVANAVFFPAVPDISTQRLGHIAALCLGYLTGANAAFWLKKVLHDGWGMALCISSTAV